MNTDHKLTAVNRILEGHRVLVALSGGVDSSLLTRLAVDILGRDNVLAVTVDSETSSAREVQMARQVAQLIGVQHEVLPASDLDNPDFVANPADRCYHCKHHLYRMLIALARERGFTLVAEGTNASDTADYRPGVRALEELGIVSPLKEAGLSKAEVRDLARGYGLPNWDQPSNACLASRFPYGTPITRMGLQRVEQGEELIRSLGFTVCRLRHHGTIARLEVEPEEISRLFTPEVRENLITGLKALGYTYITVDLEGYRTGSLNEVL